MSRLDQEKVDVNVAGKDLGVFQTFEGGELKSDDTKNRPGGMAPEESLGGFSSRDPITVTRNYKLERDHPQIGFLNQQVGRGKVVIVRTVLDVDANPVGDPITYTGRLMSCTPGNHDSASADPKMLSLEVSADEAIS